MDFLSLDVLMELKFTIQGNVQVEILNTGISMLIYLNLVNGINYNVVKFLQIISATIPFIKCSQCDSLLLLLDINIYTQ